VQTKSNKEEQSIVCQTGSIHDKTWTREEVNFEDEDEDEHGPNRIIHGTTGEEDEYEDEYYGQNRSIHGKTGDEHEDEHEPFCEGDEEESNQNLVWTTVDGMYGIQNEIRTL